MNQTQIGSGALTASPKETDFTSGTSVYLAVKLVVVRLSQGAWEIGVCFYCGQLLLLPAQHLFLMVTAARDLVAGNTSFCLSPSVVQVGLTPPPWLSGGAHDQGLTNQVIPSSDCSHWSKGGSHDAVRAR